MSRVLAVVAWVAVLAATPFVVGPYYVGLAATIGVNALLAMGLVLVTGYAGQFSLAQGAFFGVGAYGSGLLTVRLGLSPVLALVVAALVALGLAYALGRPIFRLRGHFLAMGTLALTQIFFLLATNLPITGGSSGFGGIPPFSVLGVDFLDLDMQFWLVWACVGAALWALLRIRRSRDGRALRALRAHEAAAASCGVDVTWAKTRAFAGSAFLGSIAGSLYAHQILYINPPPFDVLRSIDVLSIAVIGGLASPWGAIVGAGGLDAIRQGVDEVLPTLFGAGSVGAGETLVLGALLVVVLVVWPGGIVGGVSALWRRLRPHGPARTGESTGDGPGRAPAAAGDSARGSRALAGFSRAAGGPRDPAGRVEPVGTSPSSDADTPRRRIVGERFPSGTVEVLRAVGLSKSYGGVHALSDVDLVLHAGEVLAVIGPNGAGKSTLLNLLSGNSVPTRGTILVGDVELAGAAAHVVARHGVARSFQTPSLFGDMSVHETVLVGAHLRGRVGLVRSALPTPGAVREERRLAANAERALTEVGLLHLRDTGTAVLVIEHDMEFVMEVADRVHVLDFGETLRVGSPAEVQADPAVVSAYLGVEAPGARA